MSILAESGGEFFFYNVLYGIGYPILKAGFPSVLSKACSVSFQ